MARYRKLDDDGDMVFGNNAADFLVDSPEMVAQSVMTRLMLSTGQWFLDITEGTPYSTAILGVRTSPYYDQAIKQRVLETDGVTEIVQYASNVNKNTRRLEVTMTLNTQYGQTQPLAVPIPL